jgi:hypothetical protein
MPPSTVVRKNKAHMTKQFMTGGKDNIMSVLKRDDDDSWKKDNYKPNTNRRIEDEIPQDVFGNELRNYRGIVKVTGKNKANFNNNQKNFKNYYK